MASTVNKFQQIFTTYREIEEANPEWTHKMIEDYLSLKNDLITTADATDIDQRSRNDDLSLAIAFRNQVRIGTGDALTSDETGFTVDSTKLSVDQTEA